VGQLTVGSNPTPSARRVREAGHTVRVDEAERRAQIRRFWEYTGRDQDVSHEIYHEDAVLEFPQSGERFEGVANFKEWRSQYPAGVALEMRNLRGQGNLWVVEGAISYDGGPWQPAVNILEFRGDKVDRETIYVTEPWDAPEWRARWRAAP
jgi:SnoaL-like domain